MKFFAAAFAAIVIFRCAESAIYSPLLTQRHGPLYDGIKLLLIDEQFNANLMWNETSYHVNETTQLLAEAIDRLEGYFQVLSQRLLELSDVKDKPMFKKCFKQYEREVAHFNRELIDKYKICKFSLGATLNHIENQTLVDLAFLRNAADQIAAVADLCNIQKLKRTASNQAGIVMCVLAQIGQIDQHLYDSAQICLDIVTIMSLGTDENDLDAESCSGFYELKDKFDTVYYSIQNCMLI